MLAIIPARGGSKGLRRKNLRLLSGHPLIGRTIRTALDATRVSRVIVTTDDEEIADVARKYQAEVPFLRPASLARDDSRASDAYLHACRWLKENEGSEVTAFAVLLPTAPLTTPDDVDNAIALFQARDADSVVSVYPAPHPPEWLTTVDADGTLRNYLNDTDPLRNRQEYAQTYLPNGAVYVFRHAFLAENRDYYGPRSIAYVMPRERSIDVDDAWDLRLAQIALGSE